jgi:hypothetical protein
LNKKDQALVFATNVPGLENADLVKSFALFNISGNASTHGADEPELFGTADHTGPVFRSSMTIQALDITSTNASANFPGTPLLPPECSVGVTALLRQLGWSGDAPPGSTVADDACHTHHGNLDAIADGSIRAFANGAIAQHNTKSLNRVAGTDFRFATETEADALGAFQSWLGRRPLSEAENTAQGTTGRVEYDIASLDFVDDRIDLGRDHFSAPGEFTRNPAAGTLVSVAQNQNSGAGCNACHTNGGANTGIGTLTGIGGPNNTGQNVNVNTEVELGSDDIAEELFGLGFVLPHDEGASDSFGPAGTPAFEEAFNIQSIIEAPRKQAWFHNHRALDKFEDALAFYITSDFRLTDAVNDPNGDGNNGDFSDYINSPDSASLLAAVFTSDEVMKFGNAQKGLGTISFPNGDGIQHIGAFLRSLSAYYSLRDCERLVAEMKERIEVAERLKGKAKIDVPFDHARFTLADAQKVLKGAKLSPVPYSDLTPTLKKIDANIAKVKLYLARKKNKDAKTLLDSIADSLEAAREKIAVVKIPESVTSEEPEAPEETVTPEEPVSPT